MGMGLEVSLDWDCVYVVSFAKIKQSLKNIDFLLRFHLEKTSLGIICYCYHLLCY